MNLKDVKIFIPEIPKEWEQRTRSGHTNIWNDSFYRNGLPEIKLEPPQRGLYAERFEDGWYWVCGCSKCLKNNEKYSYIVCEEHDRCVSCGTHRKELTEIPWGHPDGFQCKPCREREHEERKQEALRLAKENKHDEWDCFREDKIICPVCASECSSEDMYEPGEDEVTCHVCDTEFVVEIEYEAKYTSRLKKVTA
ncbi:DNA methylase [Bacillus phage vB_Bacillus_1020A]|uniref:hypothetical protein n=1 Tax=Robertmurraya sp. DFI.2.37 TaxID=3031819 RepID=UPI001243A13E|nr:hypothetical protein [Robertmurraya sp. DFI.2.37]MDF1511473.1 hypothetical protein [Robertmurraya sp. DFI.2.37]QIW89357.1 DNA methylase [Bacillus phage vB_Bacillus_1020A]